MLSASALAGRARSACRGSPVRAQAAPPESSARPPPESCGVDLANNSAQRSLGFYNTSPHGLAPGRPRGREWRGVRLTPSSRNATQMMSAILLRRSPRKSWCSIDSHPDGRACSAHRRPHRSSSIARPGGLAAARKFSPRSHTRPSTEDGLGSGHAPSLMHRHGPSYRPRIRVTNLFPYVSLATGVRIWSRTSPARPAFSVAHRVPICCPCARAHARVAVPLELAPSPASCWRNRATGSAMAAGQLSCTADIVLRRRRAGW